MNRAEPSSPLPGQHLFLALCPLALVLGAATALALGRFQSLAGAGWPGLALGCGLLLVIGLRLRAAWAARRRPRRTRTRRLELEAGLAVLCLAEALLQLTGGPRSPFEPALYLVAALLAFLHPGAVGLFLGAAALALDAGVAAARGDLALGAPATRLAFLFGFVALVVAYRRVEARRRGGGAHGRDGAGARDSEGRQRGDRGAGAAQRSFGGTRAGREEAERQAQVALLALRDSARHLLELVHCATRPHTAILLWLDEDGRHLRVREVISPSAHVSTEPLRAGEGVLGGLLKRTAPVNLANLRDASRLTYYGRSEGVRAFLGVPVLVDGVARGVLAVDRKDERPFDDTDELLLGQAAREVARALENERLLAGAEAARQVQARFYRASESFREALTLEDVYRVSAEAAREIVAWDYAALTLRRGDEHLLARVFGDGDGATEGLPIEEGVSLCSMAAKNRHELPLHGEAPSHDVAVFSPRVRLRGYDSLLVLPLVARAETLGTLVLAARRPGAFPLEAREMLRVIANQAAGALENALAYARLETLATTDGLTGLLNHRHFQERTDELIARVDRKGSQAALLLCDVDHFKGINDTYGHPVGDLVLREVAQLLAGSARKVDLVARYGGEEFALVLEGTDEEGAMQLAERIRGELATRVFRCEQGSFRVTMSLGVAMYPGDAPEKHALIERADHALYAAKRGGRNRAIRATPTRPPRAEGAGA